MKFISFAMALIMAFSSIQGANGNIPGQQLAESAFSQMFPEDGSINSETYRIISGIFANIVAEGIDGSSESEDLWALVNEVPVYNEGERDATRMNIKVSPLKAAFGKVAMGVLESTTIPENIKSFIRLIVNGVYDMYIYLMPTDEEDVYRLCYDFVDYSGAEVTSYTKMLINKATGEVYNENGTGMLGSGFDYDLDTYVTTTPVNVWQRGFGYSVIYDYLGEMFFMDCNTLRIKFEYEGKDWMVQLWKGDYAFDLLVGGEIGLYNKEKHVPLQYDCADTEDELKMTMSITYDGEKIVDMDERVHWWMMGLKFMKYVPAEELTLSGSIEFKDEAMKDAFMASASQYSDCLQLNVEGNRVDLIWS